MGALAQGCRRPDHRDFLLSALRSNPVVKLCCPILHRTTSCEIFVHNARPNISFRTTLRSTEEGAARASRTHRMLSYTYTSLSFDSLRCTPTQEFGDAVTKGKLAQSGVEPVTTAQPSRKPSLHTSHESVIDFLFTGGVR